MGHSNGIITAPVGIDSDIAPVLGVGSYDLGYLCSNAHGKINPQSKKKPVKYAQLAPASNVEWWRATDGRCGFSFPATQVVIANQDEDKVWTYNPPTGGDAAPYRALDFEGYNHNASYDWLTIGIPSKIVFSDTAKITIAGTVQLEASDRLSYYETISRLFLSFRATSNGLGSYLEKELPINDVKDKGGHFQIQLTGQELKGLGLVAGASLRIHLYAFDKQTNRVSVRNHANVKTYWSVLATSADPFITSIRNQVVLKNSNNYSELWLYGLYLDLNASSYAGGKLAAGSRIQMYKYVSDTYDYQNYAQPLWEELNLPEKTVAGGQVATYTFAYPSSITINTLGITDITEIIFIWYDVNRRELARLRKHVATGSTKPGV